MAKSEVLELMRTNDYILHDTEICCDTCGNIQQDLYIGGEFLDPNNPGEYHGTICEVCEQNEAEDDMNQS